ncbi:hypothetical protein V8B97DRAFT_1915019 [Scleroderma yunnanense]
MFHELSSLRYMSGQTIDPVVSSLLPVLGVAVAVLIYTLLRLLPNPTIEGIEGPLNAETHFRKQCAVPEGPGKMLSGPTLKKKSANEHENAKKALWRLLQTLSCRRSSMRGSRKVGSADCKGTGASQRGAAARQAEVKAKMAEKVTEEE